MSLDCLRGAKNGNQSYYDLTTFLLGSSVAMMVVGLAGTASATPVAVPEIGPATATSGLALLAGAVSLPLIRAARPATPLAHPPAAGLRFDKNGLRLFEGSEKNESDRDITIFLARRSCNDGRGIGWYSLRHGSNSQDSFLQVRRSGLALLAGAVLLLLERRGLRRR